MTSFITFIDHQGRPRAMFSDRAGSRMQRFSLTLAAACSSVLASTYASAQTSPQAPSQAVSSAVHAQQLHIRIFNAKTNKPIVDERLNVALRTDQIGSVAMATDKNGLIQVDTKGRPTIRILANMYADCRPRAELYTDYAVATILGTGIVTGNLCSAITLPPKPGELLLFEIPKTYIPTYPAPPASNMPHSDELPIAH